MSAANEWDIGFEHEKINFISPRNHVLFFLLYKPTNYDVFDDFPKISDHFRRFPKIFKMLSEGCTNVSEHFPRISEVFRRLPKIAEEDPKIFDLISIYFGSFSIGTWQTLQADWSKMISHMCGYHFYPHMWDTIFLDLLPLAIPLQFI